MTQREIVLWVDERWCKALEKHLLDGTVAEKLEEHIDELVNRLPENVYERISSEIWQEQQQAKQEQEASRRFAVFHVTEESNSVYFSTQGPVELLAAAGHLRKYLRKPPGDPPARFVGMFQGERITAEQFQAYASERMDNTGRVTGAFEIDLDKGEFAALHIMDGWKVYRVKDVSAAAYHACKKQGVDSDKRLERLLEKLEGKELTANTDAQYLTGSRRLLPEEISFEAEVDEYDGKLNFYVPIYFDPDAVFGTHVATGENDDYVSVYANYDLEAGRVCDELDITLVRGDGSEGEFKYKLTESDRKALLPKMEAYCQQQWGQSLDECCQQYLSEQQQEQQSGGMTLS